MQSRELILYAVWISNDMMTGYKQVSNFVVINIKRFMNPVRMMIMNCQQSVLRMYSVLLNFISCIVHSNIRSSRDQLYGN